MEPSDIQKAKRRQVEWRTFFDAHPAKRGGYRNDYMRDLDVLTEYIEHLEIGTPVYNGVPWKVAFFGALFCALIGVCATILLFAHLLPS